MSTATLQLYELINPCDPITFEATEPAAAIVATMVGQGRFSAHPTDVQELQVVPMFAFSRETPSEWATRIYDCDWPTLAERHKADVIAALRSFVTGKATMRPIYATTLELLTDDQARAVFIDTWEDNQRSSLNQITNRAHALADTIEYGQPKDEPTPDAKFPFTTQFLQAP